MRNEKGVTGGLCRAGIYNIEGNHKFALLNLSPHSGVTIVQTSLNDNLNV